MGNITVTIFRKNLHTLKRFDNYFLTKYLLLFLFSFFSNWPPENDTRASWDKYRCGS